MKLEDAPVELEKRLKLIGAPIEALMPAQGFRAMFDFYREVRSEECDLEEDGDMLLFQWGTFDWGNGPVFTCDITRQLIAGEPEGDEDDEVMWQLSLTFHFALSEDLDELEDGNEWCGTPDELPDFEEFVKESDVYQVIVALKPVKVVLEFGEV